jgi:hypothetical protein
VRVREVEEDGWTCETSFRTKRMMRPFGWCTGCKRQPAAAQQGADGKSCIRGDLKRSPLENGNPCQAEALDFKSSHTEAAFNHGITIGTSYFGSYCPLCHLQLPWLGIRSLASPHNLAVLTLAGTTKALLTAAAAAVAPVVTEAARWAPHRTFTPPVFSFASVAVQSG